MRKAKGIFICCIFSLLFLFYLSSVFAADETLTITTYYPSPYGSYNEFKVASNTWLAYSSGSVGIGTTGPNAKLEVYGSANAIRIASNDARYMTFNHTGGTKYNFLVGAQQNVDNGFEITPSTAAGGTTYSTPALVIAGASGNVGIGTASPPGGKLYVAGNILTSGSGNMYA